MSKIESQHQSDRLITQEYQRSVSNELLTTRKASQAQADDATSLQNKLINCTLAVAIGVGLLVCAKAAEIFTAVPVSVNVVASAKLFVAYQQTELIITEKDIARGYIAVPSALRFSVITNSQYGFLVNFYPVGHIFESVEVGGIGSSAHLDESGGTIVQRGQSPKNSKYELGFRFKLQPSVHPGTYPWPLQISLQALT